VVAAIGVMWWVVALAVAGVTVLLIVHREDAAAREAPDHDEADYLRSRTPAVPVTLGDGTVTTLRRLTQSSPILLLVVNDTCQSCQGVIDSVDRYRTLLPEVEVRFLLMTAPGFSRLTSAVEPQTVHDPERYVIDSLVDDLHTPTAFLFGRDGLLAGGPETGAGRIDAFVSDIYENLHGVRPGA
jgi:hypothetical protein